MKHNYYVHFIVDNAFYPSRIVYDTWPIKKQNKNSKTRDERGGEGGRERERERERERVAATSALTTKKQTTGQSGQTPEHL